MGLSLLISKIKMVVTVATSQDVRGVGELTQVKEITSWHGVVTEYVLASHR